MFKNQLYSECLTLQRLLRWWRGRWLWQQRQWPRWTNYQSSHEWHVEHNMEYVVEEFPSPAHCYVSCCCTCHWKLLEIWMWLYNSRILIEKLYVSRTHMIVSDAFSFTIDAQIHHLHRSTWYTFKMKRFEWSEIRWQNLNLLKLNTKQIPNFTDFALVYWMKEKNERNHEQLGACYFCVCEKNNPFKTFQLSSVSRVCVCARIEQTDENNEVKMPSLAKFIFLSFYEWNYFYATNTKLNIQWIRTSRFRWPLFFLAAAFFSRKRCLNEPNLVCNCCHFSDDVKLIAFHSFFHSFYQLHFIS